MSDNKNARGRPRPAFETDFEPEQSIFCLRGIQSLVIKIINLQIIFQILLLCRITIQRGCLT